MDEGGRSPSFRLNQPVNRIESHLIMPAFPQQDAVCYRSDAPAREDDESISFEADPEVQQTAEDSSRNMINYAKEEFGIGLDWSDDSIREVERIASLLHSNYLRDEPPLERVEPYYTMIGSYVGELFRRNHGAEWGIVTIDDQCCPGIKLGPDDRFFLFWPPDKARKRIVDGPGDNLSAYYQILLFSIAEPDALS